MRTDKRLPTVGAEVIGDDVAGIDLAPYLHVPPFSFKSHQHFLLGLQPNPLLVSTASFLVLSAHWQLLMLSVRGFWKQSVYNSHASACLHKEKRGERNVG